MHVHVCICTDTHARSRGHVGTMCPVKMRGQPRCHLPPSTLLSPGLLVICHCASWTRLAGPQASQDSPVCLPSHHRRARITGECSPMPGFTGSGPANKGLCLHCNPSSHLPDKGVLSLPPLPGNTWKHPLIISRGAITAPTSKMRKLRPRKEEVICVRPQFPPSCVRLQA